MNEAFLDVIKNTQRFLLAGHERPDGDCIGAQIALYHLLCELGKDVTICNPDPAPSLFEPIAGSTPLGSVTGDGSLPEFDVLVLLDCAHVSRLGRMRPAILQRKPKILVIDHHIGSEHGDGDACFVDSSAPATGAMVLKLYRHFGVALSRTAADGVFLSIVSDTGWFRYSNTTAEVFAIASELVESGVDSAAIYDMLNRRNHVESIGFFADSLRKCEVDLDGRFGFVLIDREAIDRASRIGFDLDSVMEPLRSIGGIEVVAMLKENANGVIKISLRASSDIDVQAIASTFGGGGHRKAAGASLDGSLSDALDSVRREVKAAFAAADGVKS